MWSRAKYYMGMKEQILQERSSKDKEKMGNSKITEYKTDAKVRFINNYLMPTTAYQAKTV